MSPFDKKHLFDEKLKTTVTDKDGKFMLRYKTKNLRDLIEAKADIYLSALDKEGKKIYSSKKAVKCEPGRIEVFNIRIKRKSKPA